MSATPARSSDGVPVSYLTSNGQPTHAVIPVAEYHRLVEAATARAAERAERVLADPTTEWSDGEAVLRGLAARRLTDLRRERGLSQRALAAKAGIPQSHLSRIERAPERCTLRVLERIARALGVPVSSLV